MLALKFYNFLKKYKQHNNIRCLFRYLIGSGVDLDCGPDPALHLAIRKRYTAIALLLLEVGADFELKDSVIMII